MNDDDVDVMRKLGGCFIDSSEAFKMTMVDFIDSLYQDVVLICEKTFRVV